MMVPFNNEGISAMEQVIAAQPEHPCSFHNGRGLPPLGCDLCVRCRRHTSPYHAGAARQERGQLRRCGQVVAKY